MLRVWGRLWPIHPIWIVVPGIPDILGSWRGSRTERTGDHDTEGDNAYKVIKRNHLQQWWGRTGQCWCN